jgi:DMSO/TMAO reductase YedYZ molybdopterin-dependent catalytic subunit
MTSPIQGTKQETSIARRALLAGSGTTAFLTALGAPIPFLANLPEGVIPVAMAQTPQEVARLKPGLTVLGDRPLVMETPPHLLDGDVTPAQHFFVRNNGQTPDVSAATDASWRLRIDGEVDRALDLSIADLKREFEHVTLRLVVECAGNGRRFYRPGASGNQWTFGGVSCADWTGVRLRDVLARAGVKRSAVYTGHYGADAHLSGDPARAAISRGVPIAKAQEPHTLIAWAMNGADMPVLNGHPLRLIAPGWPGSCSQKWLNRIWVRDRVHDGEKMTGQSYRMPAYPVAPGVSVPDEDMQIIESMPVKSLITAPRTSTRTRLGQTLRVRGHAWSGETEVERVDVSLDFGATWQRANLAAPLNRYAWRRFTAELRPPERGYYEIWARATDAQGAAQPPVPPGWNPHGYNNNQQHRIGVFVS